MKYAIGFAGLMLVVSAHVVSAHAQSLTGTGSMSSTMMTTTITNGGGCALASYNFEGDRATIHWECVEKAARGEGGEYNRQMAIILKAARDSGNQPK